MTVNKITMWLAACFLLASQASPAVAQFDQMGPSHDLQFFSPVDLDFENLPRRKSSGFFFEYDKLNWAITGERATIGNPDVQVFSEIIVPDALINAFGVTSNGITAADLQYEITNGLQDVPPTAKFAWGERYEFGYFKGSNGWTMSLLDGPETVSTQTFGAPDRTFFGDQQVFGFGSIHVNFATPDNFLLGFRDYWGNGVPNNGFIAPTPTISGPGNFDTPFANADDVADDLDGDGVNGHSFILGVDINGNPIVVGIAVDMDDLHRFNVTFNQLTVRNTTSVKGGEIMRSHRVSNRHKLEKNRNSELEIGYGVRFMRLRDQFVVSGPSPLLGLFGFETETENQLVGPQIRAQYSRQKGRFGWNFDGRCMLAYNITDSDLAGSYGLDDDPDGGVFPDNAGLAPGALNRLISGQPNTFAFGRRNDEFSPVVEIRSEVSYQLTSSIAARLGYTAIFVDNISRAAAVTRYSLPGMSFNPAGEQNIFINGANFGFDVVY